jgi:glutaredoxin
MKYKNVRLLFCLQLAMITVATVFMSSVINPVYAAEPEKAVKEPAVKEKPGDYPPIILYSTTWCYHCNKARDYFKANKIPYVNRDVEQDKQAEKLLTETYKSLGVPVVVIGTGANEVVLRGFSPKRFEDALKKAQTKK